MSLPLSTRFEYANYWRDPDGNPLGLCPAWGRRLDASTAHTYNRLMYAITDAKRDIARLDLEFGGLR